MDYTEEKGDDNQSPADFCPEKVSVLPEGPSLRIEVNVKQEYPILWIMGYVDRFMLYC